jgi:hypothetical protein
MSAVPLLEAERENGLQNVILKRIDKQTNEDIAFTKSSIDDNDRDEVETPQFVAKTTNIQLLHRLISSVQAFGNYCTLDITSQGMCFSISDGNVCKVRLNLNKKVFQNYTFNGVWISDGKFTDTQLYGEDTDLSDDDNDIGQNNKEYQRNAVNDIINKKFDENAIISINLDISSFLETINIHIKDKKTTESGVECTFRYERNGDPFIMMFEDEFIIEKCQLNTYILENIAPQNRRNGKNETLPDKNQDFEDVSGFFNDNSLNDESIFRLDTKKVLFEIVVKSYILHDTIKDMCDLNTDKFILYCKQNKINNESNHANNDKNFKLIFISKSKSDTIGFSKIIIPNKVLDVPKFEVFKPLMSTREADDETLDNCFDLSLSSTYHFDYFAKLLKAFKLSKLIKIRKDMNGITSLLFLLVKNANTTQQSDSDGLFGSSIEFITLESISINELSALNVENENPSLLSKLGYNNAFVEQLIKDDHDIQTIRIGNDGQFITLDNFFGNANAEFNQIEFNDFNFNNNNYNNNFANNDEFIPIEQITNSKSANPEKISSKLKDQNSNILKLTEQLTMSLLGHPTPIGMVDGSENENNIQVEKSIIEEDDDINEGINKKRKRTTNNVNKRSKNNKLNKKDKKSNGDRKKNNGIETVGGAIEIPLFI